MKILSLRKGWIYFDMKNLRKLKERLWFLPFYHKQNGYSLRVVR